MKPTRAISWEMVGFSRARTCCLVDSKSNLSALELESERCSPLPRFPVLEANMDELKSAMEDHMDQMADLVQKLTAELRSGIQPAYENLLGFVHAIDWKEPFLMGLIGFHVFLLLITILSRKHLNFQMSLFLLALLGVFLAERLNRFLGEHWKTFATQNYFDPHGVFLSTLWSGPLIMISMIILINTLFSMCTLMVRWKRAELRHRARLSQKKDE